MSNLDIDSDKDSELTEDSKSNKESCPDISDYSQKKKLRSSKGKNLSSDIKQVSVQLVDFASENSRDSIVSFKDCLNSDMNQTNEKVVKKISPVKDLFLNKNNEISLGLNMESNCFLGQIQQYMTEKTIKYKRGIKGFTVNSLTEIFGDITIMINNFVATLDQTKTIEESVNILKKEKGDEEKLSPINDNLSYADVTKKNVRKNKKSVILSNKNKNDKRNVKEILHTLDKPDSLKIEKIINLKSGDIKMDLESFDSLDSIIEKELSEHFEVNIIKPKLTKLLVYSTQSNIEEESVVLEKINKQFPSQNNTYNCVLRNFESKFSGYNWCILVNDEVAREILKRGGINFGYNFCKTIKCWQVFQCRNCWLYGHSTNRCTNKTFCGICSDEHPTSTCESNYTKCINCVYENTEHKCNLDINHSAFSRGCKLYQNEIEKIKIKSNSIF